MTEQICWDDIAEGMEITPLAKVGSTQMLIRWAGASGDFNPLHYDHTLTEFVGVGKPIIHGALKRQWLIQMLTDWMGDYSFLKKFSCQYRAMDFPRQMKTMSVPQDGETWWCKGKVTKKYMDGDEHCVDVDIHLENGKGEVTTSGKATIVLPVCD